MSVALLATLVAGVILINLAVGWVIVRMDFDVRGLLDADPLDPDGVDDAAGDGDADGGVAGEGDAVGERDAVGGDDGVGGGVGLGSDGGGVGLGGDDDRDAVDGEPPPLDADGDTAVCQHCGAENRAGYRYCRWCVRRGMVPAELDRGDDTTTARRPL